MNLRIARKLVARRNGGYSSESLFRRAVERWVRWPYRPRNKFQSSSEHGFRWLDEQGRIHPPPKDVLEACLRWQASRRVAETTTLHGWVSTVFLGIDHSFGHGPPLYFETAVKLPGQEIAVLQRHVSRAKARAYHDVIVGVLQAGGSPFLDQQEATA